MFDKIRLFYFIAAFSLGICYVYATNPPPEVVLKFPSPNNAGKFIYKDGSDTCYKYESTKVDCYEGNKKKANVVPQPVTENFKPGYLKNNISSIK
jgi:hypothetical protein